MLPLLDIQALAKHRAERHPRFCASIEHLELFPGDALGITGSSGCGKSTLLEMLALLTRPSSVRRFLLRTPAREYDLARLWRHEQHTLTEVRRHAMGFVHQAGGLFFCLNVRDNIAFSLRLNGASRAFAAQRTDELLDFLDLRHLPTAMPETLSYGERQRVAVARALAHTPCLVLADEPTSALDPQSAHTVMTLLRQGAQRFGAALLVVSHDHALLDSVGIPSLPMRLASDAAPEALHYVLPSPPLPPRHAADSAAPPPREASEYEDSASRYAANASRGGVMACELAWRDFWHERTLSLCAAMAFAAALTPLLVLLGLREGVIALLSQRLLDNPAVLAIIPYGSTRYTDADIAALAALPSVGFVLPLTRTLASTVLVERQGRPPLPVDVVPTGPGDPLLTRYATVPPEGGAVITQELARALGADPMQQELALRITRRHAEQLQSVVCHVRVCGVLPDAADWKNRIYVPLSLLQDMERYRDGVAVPSRGWAGTAQTSASTSYAGFRMYVDSLEAVTRTRDILKQRGIDAYTSAREVEAIQKLKQALTMTTLLVGGVTLVGMAFSLASLAVSNVQRKARLFAQGSLMGLQRGKLLQMPLWQMALVAVVAAVCSLVLYVLAATVVDIAAAPWLAAGEHACVLPVAQAFWVCVAALLLSCACGAVACVQVLRLQPAEVLRCDA